MDTHNKQLDRIKNYIQQASVCDEKGLACLYYLVAIELLQELSMELNNCISTLENEGEQPEEVLRIWLLPSDMKMNILDL